MTIGFIGLGKMGIPIAKNLIQAGFSVKIYNRTPGKGRELIDIGARILETPQEAVQKAELVITMLSDDAAVTEICGKIIPAMKPGSIHLSMSTIAPATAELLQAVHQQHAVEYLGSPVMGRPPAAEAKQLFILLSGNTIAKEKVKPVLEAISQRIFDFGTEPATAHTVKVTLNFMIFTIIELLSEVMLLAEKMSIDKNLLLETMTNTIFGAPVFKLYGNLVVQEKEIPNGFTTSLSSKDLRLVQETAANINMSLPLADLIQNHFKEIIQNGAGHKDVSLLITHLRNSIKN